MMGAFSFFKKRKPELTDEQKKWEKMWNLWLEGCVASPYAELMTYESEVNNGGHDQYFFNIENTGDLQAEITVLETVLPAKLQLNLRNAYNAYLLRRNKKNDEQVETMLDQCDGEFYKDEDEILCILREYASRIL